MSRTIVDWEILNETIKNAKKYIITWLEKNNFKILTTDSDGSLIKYGYMGAKVKLLPKAGNLISIYYTITTGAIVFEFDVQRVNNSVKIHGEFYAAGAGILVGKEYDLAHKSGLMAKWPREYGYILFSEFQDYIKSTSKDDFEFKAHKEIRKKQATGIVFISKWQLAISFIQIIVAVIIILVIANSRSFNFNFIYYVFVWIMSIFIPLLLIPGVSNILLYLTINKEMDNQFISKRCFSYGSILIIIALLIPIFIQLSLGISKNMSIEKFSIFMMLIVAFIVLITWHRINV
jgi:hypothetical protein